MSTYTKYVEDRLRAAREEEARRRDEADATDYEAALMRLGVTLGDDGEEETR